ncbi:glycosyltransferase family 2 protein [Microbacterium sp. P04]|uniref:glycosyltransferase family 2 protein n=1 Tax=Microbacterium sp. P04 TaxID=3366947 RepID=UPI003744C0A1
MNRPTPAADRPTISVVIPVKNDARLLARCLAALAAQTVTADEIIVVDNGSTDASATVALEAGAVVVPCAHLGIPAAAATGYDAASGDLILRLDADCIPEATWIAEMRAAFAARADVSVFTGGARFIDGPSALRTLLAAVYLATYTAFGAPALGHLPVFGSNLGFRRSAWRSIRTTAHRSDAELHDDLDLSYHFGEHHRIRALPAARMGISMRPFASGRGFARRMWRGVRTVVVHWPADLPPVRWQRLLRRRLRHHGAALPATPSGRVRR